MVSSERIAFYNATLAVAVYAVSISQSMNQSMYLYPRVYPFICPSEVGILPMAKRSITESTPKDSLAI